MRNFLMVVASLCLLVANLWSQFQLQDARTTAGLRGVHAVSDSVAWASGSDGAVLRTSDSGAHWTHCAVPPGGDKLDFRGIWAWSADAAMVLASGPGEASRIYETQDGCAHWTERLRNHDPQGFWDAMVFQAGDFGFAIGDARTGIVIGDPVGGHFATHVMLLGQGWFIDDRACAARPDEAAFAASNSSVFVFGSRRFILGTGGKGGPRAILSPLLAYEDSSKSCLAVPVPIAGGNDSSGIFSLYFRDLEHGVAVGGDYKKPAESLKTAALTSDGGRHWTLASRMPHGYRSAVTWDPQKKIWIAVGPNGADVSRDDGTTWQPLDEGSWNAISLPFVVGPNGRIGRLNDDAAR